jgi:DNA-binding NarL/FixJ family response regulator
VRAVTEVVAPADDVAEVDERSRGRNDWADRLHALVQAGMILTSDLSLPSLLQRLVEVAREVIGARYAALGVFEGHRLTQFVTSGIDAETVARIGHRPEGRGLLGALLDHSAPIRLRRLKDDPRSVGFPLNHLAMESFLGVPLVSRGQSLGNLYLTDKQGAPEFSQDDEALAIMLGAQAAIAIENAQLFETASRAAALEERNRIGQALQDAVARVLFSVGLESTEAADIGKLLERVTPMSGPIPEDAVQQMANGLRRTIDGHEPIAERELQIIRLLAKGRSNRDIGHDLFLSENTIRYHIHKILQKLDVSHRIEIVRVAMERHLI